MKPGEADTLHPDYFRPCRGALTGCCDRNLIGLLVGLT